MKLEFKGSFLTARAENERDNNIILGLAEVRMAREPQREVAEVTGDTEKRGGRRVWVAPTVLKNGKTRAGFYKVFPKKYAKSHRYTDESGHVWKNKLAYAIHESWKRRKASGGTGLRKEVTTTVATAQQS